MNYSYQLVFDEKLDGFTDTRGYHITSICEKDRAFLTFSVAKVFVFRWFIFVRGDHG